MTLKVGYDQEFNVLSIRTGERVVSGASLMHTADIVVDIKTQGGYAIEGLTIIGASAYLSPYFIPEQPQEPNQAVKDNPYASYDQDTDTLTLGAAANDPTLKLEGEHFVGHWQPDELDDTDFDIIGVSLRDASKHLAPFFRLNLHQAGAIG